MNATMQSRIEEHGRKLLAIFPNATERDPVKLCKRLRRQEAVAHRAAENWCNGTICESSWEATCADVLRVVQHILGDWPTVFVNGDARGYALKIDDAIMRENNLDLHRDWGGFGIIAPDLSE